MQKPILTRGVLNKYRQGNHSCNNNIVVNVSGYNEFFEANEIFEFFEKSFNKLFHFNSPNRADESPYLLTDYNVIVYDQSRDWLYGSDSRSRSEYIHLELKDFYYKETKDPNVFKKDINFTEGKSCV